MKGGFYSKAPLAKIKGSIQTEVRKRKDGGYGLAHSPNRAVRLSNSAERSCPGAEARGVVSEPALGVACTVCGARTPKMGK